MDLTGDYRIPAPREAVWAALNDPEILKGCIPGCETLNKTSETEFIARVVAKIGPVKAGFNGKVTLSDLDPPSGYTITGEGQGGAAGFAKGGAKVRLEPVDNGAATVLHYVADAQIGGKLAQIGSRLVEGTARKLADDFFACFAAKAAAIAPAVPTAAPTPVVEPAPQPEPAPVVASAPTGGGLSPVVWIVGLVVIIAIILGFVVLR